MDKRQRHHKLVLCLTIVVVIIAVVGILFFSGVFFISYRVVSSASEAKKIRPPVAVQQIEKSSVMVVSSVVPIKKSSMKEDTQYFSDLSDKLQQLASIQLLFESIQKEQRPPICEILCDQSHLDIPKDIDKPIAALIDYYNHRGQDALLDPKFRLVVAQTALIAQIFPPSVNDLILDLKEFYQNSASSEAEKLWLSSRITTAFFREAYLINKNVDRNKHHSQILAEVMRLHKQCSSGNLEELTMKCKQIQEKNSSLETL